MKIVTVRLLIDAPSEQEAYDVVNESLRPITRPEGSGMDDKSAIVDYSVGDARPAPEEIVAAVREQRYAENSF
jgi:hypothetical protein